MADPITSVIKLEVTQDPGISLRVPKRRVSATKGNIASFRVQTKALPGFTDTVGITVDGVPTGSASISLGDDGYATVYIDTTNINEGVHDVRFTATPGATGLTPVAGPTATTELPATQIVVGPTGPTGPVGEQGARGARGATGANGSVGPEGPGGAQGVTGPTGADGADGATGATGPAGAKGATGANGSNGATGGRGATGPTGAAGSAGPMFVPINADSAAATWTNMPLAATFFMGSYRHITRADLTGYTQGRLIVNKQGTSAAAAGKLILRYRTAFSTTVGDYSDIGTSEVSVAVNTTNTVLSTNWVNLAAGAKADVYIAVVGSGGDGAVDPVFGSISAQFK